MAGFIRGMDPRENMYLYAHDAGRHFRRSRSSQVGVRTSVASITIDAKGQRLQTVTIQIRRPQVRKTAHEMGLAAIPMSEK